MRFVASQLFDYLPAFVHTQSTHKVVVAEVLLDILTVMKNEVEKLRAIWLDMGVNKTVESFVAVFSHALVVVVEDIQLRHAIIFFH